MDLVIILSRCSRGWTKSWTSRRIEDPGCLPERSTSAGGSYAAPPASVPLLWCGSIRLIESWRGGFILLLDRYVAGLFRACNVNLLVRCADSVIRQVMIPVVTAVSKLSAWHTRPTRAYGFAAYPRSTWQGEGQGPSPVQPLPCAALRHVKTPPVFTLSCHGRAAAWSVGVRR
jgi:hypothetical protein